MRYIFNIDGCPTSALGNLFLAISKPCDGNEVSEGNLGHHLMMSVTLLEYEFDWSNTFVTLSEMKKIPV